jgi:nucleotide-binding universal stress UspA family protein
MLQREKTGMFQKILVATDGSDNALRAARQIAEMIKRQPAEVTVLCAAYVPSRYRDDLSEEITESFLTDGRQALRFTAEVFHQEGLTCTSRMIQDKHPADAILDEAHGGGYDLIALGSRGLSQRDAKRLGSVSQEVAGRAKCSVLLVR